MGCMRSVAFDDTTRWLGVGQFGQCEPVVGNCSARQILYRRPEVEL
jgi:hypothetical protein